jgi:hypothetical protein
MKFNNTKYDYYKKKIFVFILIFFTSLILIKFFLNLVKSEIQNIVNSKKFEVFIYEQVNKKLDNFANKQLTQEEYVFYKDAFKKIYIKYKPLFQEIYKETQ